jgi:hypothetical protein
MESLIAGDLRIDAFHTEATAPIRLVWQGKSNDRQPGRLLTPYFRIALSAAAEGKVPVELHFEKLDHFNSSTITSIIQLIQDARSAAVRLVLVYDGTLKWQRLSFDALRVFAKDDLLELRSV